MSNHKITATGRKDEGKGASRRLRRAGKTPGILYGGNEPAVLLELDHNEIFQLLRKEEFHASILTLNLDGKPQRVLLRAFNMHPWRREVQHVDFQRVAADQKITMKVPLHFLNQENNDAVKLHGATITHVLNEIEIKCLPDALPQYIEVDLTNIPVNGSIHAHDIKLPPGVELANRNENPAVVVANVPAGAEEAAGEAAAAPAEETK